MPNSERPWERVPTRDGELSRSAAGAIGLAFIVVVLVSLAVVGMSFAGVVVGAVAGTVVAALLGWLAARSDRGPTDGPPPQLL